ncbi:MAG TPA: hypothetical protein VGE32_14240, partial [Cellvibrio sp.]
NLERSRKLTTTEILEMAAAILASLGGGSVIVYSLSSFLARTISERILQNERHENDKILSEFKNRIDSLERKQALNHQQKIDLYKIISEPLANLTALITSSGITQEHMTEFDRERLNLTAKLALFASQDVFNSYNDLIDYIYDSIESQNYSFPEFRVKALALLSEMRKDIGIYEDDVTYNGSR